MSLCYIIKNMDKLSILLVKIRFYHIYYFFSDFYYYFKFLIILLKIKSIKSKNIWDKIVMNKYNKKQNIRKNSEKEEKESFFNTFFL